MTDLPAHPFTRRGLLVCAILVSCCLLSSAQTPADQEPVEDIRDIMVERPPASIVPVLVSIVLLVVAGFFGFLAFRKFFTKERAVPGPPPEIVARRRLNAISGKVDELPPNKASLETSDAVKDFLTAQYRDPIRYETAEEYLHRITNAQQGDASRLSPSLTEQVQSFVSISQELKFAKLKEARSQIPSLIKQAENIIGTSVREKTQTKR
jgi:hypothetical protein